MDLKSTTTGILDDGYARQRRSRPELKFRYRVRAALVAKTARAYLSNLYGIKIVEFGAADGLTLVELDRLLPNNQILGLEYSKALVDQAVDLPPNISLVEADVTAVGDRVEDGTCDVVSAPAMLEHLVHPLDAIKEAHRILKPGGLFVATCPHPLWDDISVRLGLLNAGQHESLMDKKKMITLVEQAGFSLVFFKRFMWSPISFLPYLKVSIPPSVSLSVDEWIAKLKVLDWSFVNQVVVAKKP